MEKTRPRFENIRGVLTPNTAQATILRDSRGFSAQDKDKVSVIDKGGRRLDMKVLKVLTPQHILLSKTDAPWSTPLVNLLIRSLLQK